MARRDAALHIGRAGGQAQRGLGDVAAGVGAHGLAEILDLEIKRACFYFYFGHTISQKAPNSKLLQSALLTGFQSVIDFIAANAGTITQNAAGLTVTGAASFTAAGDDITLKMPVGTIITDAETGEVLYELLTPGEVITIAKGGDGGFGNMRFKSAINRAPRQKTPGWPGEKKQLKLELKVLADVGLLGMPNAGKSTLIRAISAARPKVADYPFTTLQPNLGVVRADENRSFVVADIPGLIEGAAEGAGLGHQFLRHLARTKLLLHVIDVIPPDPDADVVRDAKALIRELRKYDEALYRKPRWLVFNKLDLVPEKDREKLVQSLLKKLGVSRKHFAISAISGDGCRPLVFAAMEHLEQQQDKPQKTARKKTVKAEA